MIVYPSYRPVASARIASVPAHWDVKSIKHLGRYYNGYAFAPSDWHDEGLPIIRIQNLTNADAPFNRSATRVPDELYVRRGDVLVSWSASLGVYVWDREDAVLNQHIFKAVPEEGINPGFFAWVMRWALSELADSAHGSTMQHLTKDVFGSFNLPAPPPKEQLAIASYLDAETARIDGLIEEKRRLACMLVELRAGVIRERTTGADLKVARVSTGDVFMPQLPVGWDLVSLGRYSRITNGSTPLKDNLAYWQGGHYPWLNSSVVNGDEVTEGSELVTAEALRQCHLPIVPQGSVLVALTGQGKTRGQATVLRIEATINQHLAAIVCDEDHLDGEFVFWALTGQYPALRMVSDGQGGTKGALTCDELGRFRIPKPPIDEQRLIAKALYDETRKIDDLLKHVEDEIQMLQELRAATITDAVLGRMDVREHMKN